ncbi:MAG: MAPEG family protein [Acidobacteriota bacterium]|nr:MAPEG family protein [Acidobacteriota bacterium]
MTIAYWCVLIAALLPVVFTGYAKMTNRYGPGANHDPRAFQEKLKGRGRRAHNAHLNSFEAFPIFAAAVIIAHQVGTASQSTIDYLAIGFIAARLVYGFLYIADYASLRSLVWTAGHACAVAMFVVSA